MSLVKPRERTVRHRPYQTAATSPVGLESLGPSPPRPAEPRERTVRHRPYHSDADESALRPILTQGPEFYSYQRFGREGAELAAEGQDVALFGGVIAVAQENNPGVAAGILPQ